MLSIWEEAGGAAPSTANDLPAAGKKCFVEDPKENMEPKQRPLRRHVDGVHSALEDNLTEIMVPADGTEVGGLDGHHSHKKVGYVSGLRDSVVIEGGALTAINVRPDRKRHSLEPEPAGVADALTGAPALSSPPRSPPVAPRDAHLSDEIAEAMARSSHQRAVAVPRAEASPAQRAQTLAQQRLLQRVVASEARVLRGARLAEAVRAGNCDGGGTTASQVGESQFRVALEAAGLVLGEGDLAKIWSAVGGEVGRTSGRLKGTVDLEQFYAAAREREADDGSRKAHESVKNSGYPQHMQGSLTMTWGVRDDVPVAEQQQPRGALRAGVEFVDHVATLESGGAARPPSPELQAADGDLPRASLVEAVRSKVRAGGERALLAAFGADPRAVAQGAEYIRDREAGRELSFAEVRGALADAGVAVGDADYEQLWRRMDARAHGRVALRDARAALALDAEDSPGKLPRAARAPRAADSEAADERRAARAEAPPPDAGAWGGAGAGDSGREERVFLDVLKKNPSGLRRLVEHCRAADAEGGRAVAREAFGQRLLAAGLVLSEADAGALFRSATRAGGRNDGRVSAEDVAKLALMAEERASGGAAAKTPLLGFGTGHALLKSEGPLAKHRGSFGVDDPAMRAVYMKVGGSAVGNPHRLRQLFHKYDADRAGRIGVGEMLRTLAIHNVPLSREERAMLGAVADTAERGYVEYEKLISAIAQVHTPPRPYAPRAAPRAQRAAAVRAALLTRVPRTGDAARGQVCAARGLAAESRPEPRGAPGGAPPAAEGGARGRGHRRAAPRGVFHVERLARLAALLRRLGALRAEQHLLHVLQPPRGALRLAP